jgi:hypothetical protein
MSIASMVPAGDQDLQPPVLSAVLAHEFRIPGDGPLKERSEQIVKPAPERFGGANAGAVTRLRKMALLTKEWAIMIASYQIVT